MNRLSYFLRLQKNKLIATIKIIYLMNKLFLKTTFFYNEMIFKATLLDKLKEADNKLNKK